MLLTLQICSEDVKFTTGKSLACGGTTLLISRGSPTSLNYLLDFFLMKNCFKPEKNEFFFSGESIALNHLEAYGFF